MADSAHAAIVSADPTGRIIAWNASAERIFGYSAAEALGQPLTLIMPERHRAGHTAGMERLARGESSRVIGSIVELEGLRKDGREFPLELSLSAWQHGGQAFFSGIIQDITVRKANEAMLRQFKETLDTIHDAVFTCDLETLRFTYVNRGACLQVGYDEADLLTLHPYDIKPAFDERAYRALIAPLLDGRRTRLSFETVHRHRDGHDIPVDVLLQLQEGLSKSVLQAVVRDVTARKRAEEAHDDILAQTSDLVQSIGPDGALLYVNEAWKRTLGYTDAEVGGLNVFDVIAPDSVPHCQAIFGRLMRGESPGLIELAFRSKDGRRVEVEGNLSVRPDEQGRMVSTRGIFRDITARGLIATAAFQRAIVEHAGVAIVTGTPDGVITSFNPEAERLLGYAAADLVGQQTFAIFHDPAEVAARARSVSEELGEPIAPGCEVLVARARRGGSETREWTYVCKNGDHTPVLLTVSALRDQAGTLIGFLGVARDISEIKRAEAAQWIQQLLLTSALQLAKAGHWVYDVDRDLFTFNDTFYAVFRTTAAVVGAYELPSAVYAARFVHPDDQEIVAREIGAALAAKSRTYVRELQHRFLYADGGTGHMVVRFGIQKDAAGRVVQLYGVNQDVSVRVAAEHRLTGQLQLLEASNRQLQQSNAELAEFARVAAHDLQTPLRAVSSCVELLAKEHAGRFDARSQEFARHAVEGARQMQTLINDLLTYAHVGRPGVAVGPVEVDRCLDEALSRLAVPIRESGAYITRDALPVVKAEGRELALLFEQLLDNAVKFRRAEPLRIHVGAQPLGPDACEVTVRDNGIGFDPSYTTRIFQLFERLTSSDAGGGTGLGLAIARKIVEARGGRIWAESEPGQGTVIHFTLPQVDSPE